MQIVINQVEIEQAIRNYIHEQINIKEGMAVSIDLRSTRGTEGFTASIDIMKAGTTNKPAIPTEPVKREVQEEPVKQQEMMFSLPDQIKEEDVSMAPAVTEEQPKKSLFGALRKPVNETVTVS